MFQQLVKVRLCIQLLLAVVLFFITNNHTKFKLQRQNEGVFLLGMKPLISTFTILTFKTTEPFLMSLWLEKANFIAPF